MHQHTSRPLRKQWPCSFRQERTESRFIPAAEPGTPYGCTAHGEALAKARAFFVRAGTKRGEVHPGLIAWYFLWLQQHYGQPCRAEDTMAIAGISTPRADWSWTKKSSIVNPLIFRCLHTFASMKNETPSPGYHALFPKNMAILVGCRCYSQVEHLLSGIWCSRTSAQGHISCSLSREYLQADQNPEMGFSFSALALASTPSPSTPQGRSMNAVGRASSILSYLRMNSTAPFSGWTWPRQ